MTKHIVAALEFLAGEDVALVEETPDNYLDPSDPALTNYLAIRRYMSERKGELWRKHRILSRFVYSPFRLLRMVSDKEVSGWLIELRYADENGKPRHDVTVSDEDFERAAKIYLPSHPQCLVSCD